eukprot:572615-Prorocentrum_lima.AAC.1
MNQNLAWKACGHASGGPRVSARHAMLDGKEAPEVGGSIFASSAQAPAAGIRASSQNSKIAIRTSRECDHQVPNFNNL